MATLCATSTEQTPATEERRSVRTRPDPADAQVKQPKQWHVVLLDDDDHSYEYVIRMMQELFAHPVEKGFQIAQAVDTQGRAICLTTHKERAEFKRDQIHAYGRDPLMARSKGSMSAVIEPADLGDDDHGGEGGEGKPDGAGRPEDRRDGPDPQSGSGSGSQSGSGGGA
ncbi:MAG: ATP-dependent Clp protease adaptor ClpS [Planctomycetota bacterium]|nr:ATP-dependent Clp protease adaptor ClpS [Planctomycetota bacterium]